MIMTYDRVVRTLLGICTAVLVFGGLYSAQSILAPVAFSFFIIAIVWPFQRRLQAAIPKLLALAVTVLIILVVITLFAWLMIW
jgi:AI-2 transport protein TqsA